MTNLVIFNYYYRAKQNKKLVKSLVESNAIANAITKLNSVIIEHDNYINNGGIVNDGNNFSSVDNMQLYHAKLHLESFDLTGQTSQKNATVQALLEDHELPTEIEV